MTAPVPRPCPDVAGRLAEALAAAWRRGVPFVVDPAEGHANRIDWDRYADALLPVVDAIAAERAAEELELAYREDGTTVAKLSPVERLTCRIVKTEDLLARAAALAQPAPGPP